MDKLLAEISTLQAEKAELKQNIADNLNRHHRSAESNAELAFLRERLIRIDQQIANQTTVLSNQTTILANETTILANQAITRANETIILAEEKKQQTFLMTSVQVGAARRDSPEHLKHVFILGFVPETASDDYQPSVELIGTAFAVTKRHVVTTGYNLLDPSTGKELSGHWFIARKATKDSGRYTMPAAIAVTITMMGPDEDGTDWAVLQVLDPSQYFESYVSICLEPSLPNLELESADLKTLYAPIRTFQTSGIVNLHVWTDEYRRVLQYDKEGTVIIVATGLSRGSCGSPYISKTGKAVALHLASTREDREPLAGSKRKHVAVAGPSEATKEVVEQEEEVAAPDVSDGASVRLGLVLARVPRIVSLVALENSVPRSTV